MPPTVFQRLWSALLGRLVRLHSSIRPDILRRLAQGFWSSFLTIIRRLFASRTSTCSHRGDEPPPNPTPAPYHPPLSSDEKNLTNALVPATFVVLASSVPGQIAQPASDMEMVSHPAAGMTTDTTDSTPQSTANAETQPGTNNVGLQPWPNSAGLQHFQIGNLLPIRPGVKSRWFARPEP